MIGEEPRARLGRARRRRRHAASVTATRTSVGRVGEVEHRGAGGQAVLEVVGRASGPLAGQRSAASATASAQAAGARRAVERLGGGRAAWPRRPRRGRDRAVPRLAVVVHDATRSTAAHASTARSPASLVDEQRADRRRWPPRPARPAGSRASAARASRAAAPAGRAWCSGSRGRRAWGGDRRCPRPPTRRRSSARPPGAQLSSSSCRSMSRAPST